MLELVFRRTLLDGGRFTDAECDAIAREFADALTQTLKQIIGTQHCEAISSYIRIVRVVAGAPSAHKAGGAPAAETPAASSAPAAGEAS